MYKIFFVLLFLFSSLIAGYSQDTLINYDALPILDYSNPREYEIADVSISGVQYLQKEVLVSLSGLQIGEKITVPSEDITNVIKKFWDQGLFSDVKISATKIQSGKIWLDIYLKERPRMSKLTINGIKKSETQDIMDKLNIRSGSQVTDDILNTIRRIIREHFVDKGYLNTTITIREIPDTIRVNMVQLIADVNKNGKVKIEDVVFTGNKVFPTKKLRKELKKTKGRDLNIFKPSKLIKKDFIEDKEKLIEFYNENGYRDAKILSDSISKVSEDRINLNISIYEGDKYYFGDIVWIGNTKYPEELLSKVLGIKKGDVFDQKLLDKRLLNDEDAVNSLYLDYGYLFSSIEAVEVKVDKDTIDFEMRIYEGKPATVNNIIIEGNDVTNEHVIRREIRTKPGDLFSKQDIIRTVRELAQLGHFDPEQIEPEPIPNPSNGTVDIRYKLVEKSNNQFEVSGGWGYGMLVGTVGLRFTNFSARNILDGKAWRPIPTGDGQTVSIRAQSNGKYYQSYNLSFIEPWFGGKKPNSFSVSLYRTKMNSSYGYYSSVEKDQYMKITGASLGLGKRLKWPDDFFTLYNELTYQRYSLKDYTGYFFFTNGNSNNLSFSTTLGRSSVSQPIYPRNGSSFSLSLQLTPPFSAISGKDFSNVTAQEEKYKWIEYHKWKFKADWYTTLAGNLVLYTRAHFGYKGFYNKDIGPSPFEGFDLGGDGLTGYNIYGYETIALRGYSNSSLTPRINGTKSGNVYEKLTMELRYPFTLNPSATIFGLVFAEAGNSWYSIEDYNPFLVKRSLGVGLRAFLPMFGLLGIDWGYGFDDVPNSVYGHSGPNFHFTLGQQF
ncbi:MAG: outer membrane protein assembly factor BamA [Bacteroidales bacterium]|nr:outer membrane protein assembly factor BamA [Bacteroidales bacterium]